MPAFHTISLKSLSSSCRASTMLSSGWMTPRAALVPTWSMCIAPTSGPAPLATALGILE
jgi:hypothetical protein